QMKRCCAVLPFRAGSFIYSVTMKRESLGDVYTSQVHTERNSRRTETRPRTKASSSGDGWLRAETGGGRRRALVACMKGPVTIETAPAPDAHRSEVSAGMSSSRFIRYLQEVTRLGRYPSLKRWHHLDRDRALFAFDRRAVARGVAIGCFFGILTPVAQI